MTQRASEHDIQATFVEWLRLNEHREPRLAMMYAVPNGGKRSPKTALALKAEGVLRGVSDMHLPVSCHGYHGLWIEFKARGGKQTPAQAAWEQCLIEQGHYARVCRSVEDAVETVEWYLGMVNDG